jgi:hypothetical protein
MSSQSINEASALDRAITENKWGSRGVVCVSCMLTVHVCACVCRVVAQLGVGRRVLDQLDKRLVSAVSVTRCE